MSNQIQREELIHKFPSSSKWVIHLFRENFLPGIFWAVGTSGTQGVGRQGIRQVLPLTSWAELGASIIFGSGDDDDDDEEELLPASPVDCYLD